LTLAVNQFTVSDGQHTRRPDVLLFVNGLPLAVIELKNPADENATIWTAFKQLHIVLIADEAHRSQYDFIDGFAPHLHDEIVRLRPSWYHADDDRGAIKVEQAIRKYQNRAIETHKLSKN
jgi:hypothetical protein